MVDIEYVDELIGLLDAIAHPVFTASGSPLAFERLAVFTHGARPGASRRSSTPNLYSEPSPIQSRKIVMRRWESCPVQRALCV